MGHSSGRISRPDGYFYFSLPVYRRNAQAHTEDDQDQAFEVIAYIACQRRKKVART
jgi:hypothetical protein